MVILLLADNAIQLVPDGTLVFHLVLIILMVALLNATLLKPINRILAERDLRTKGRLSEAQETLLRVEEKLREYERRLRDARTEGYTLLEQERLVISGEREHKLSTLRGEIARELSDEKETLKLQAGQARAQLLSDARTRAVEISRRILNRAVAE